MWCDASPHASTMGNDIAIRAVGISKRYRAGQRGRYRNLRDAIAGALSVFGRRGPTSACAATSGATHAPVTDAHGYFWALKDVSFEVKLGEAVGIIGPNGAGKSTLLKILGRVTRPTAGYADVTGRVGSLFEVGTGFNSELSGRENVYLSGAILGMKKKQIDRKFDQIVAFADIEPFLDTAVKYYSTGMFVRIAFAVAAHLDTDILLVDDVLAVGDAGFREKCLRKMEAVIGEGRTVVLVSHDMTTVNALCGRTLRMEHGLLVPPRAGPFPPDGARRTGADVALDSARADRHGAGGWR